MDAFKSLPKGSSCDTTSKVQPSTVPEYEDAFSYKGSSCHTTSKVQPPNVPEYEDNQVLLVSKTKSRRRKQLLQPRSDEDFEMLWNPDGNACLKVNTDSPSTSHHNLDVMEMKEESNCVCVELPNSLVPIKMESDPDFKTEPESINIEAESVVKMESETTLNTDTEFISDESESIDKIDYATELKTETEIIFEETESAIKIEPEPDFKTATEFMILGEETGSIVRTETLKVEDGNLGQASWQTDQSVASGHVPNFDVSQMKEEPKCDCKGEQIKLESEFIVKNETELIHVETEDEENWFLVPPSEEDTLTAAPADKDTLTAAPPVISDKDTLTAAPAVTPDEDTFTATPAVTPDEDTLTAAPAVTNEDTLTATPAITSATSNGDSDNKTMPTMEEERQSRSQRHKDYSDDKLRAVIEAVLKEEVSTCVASEKFDIPPNNIFSRVKGKHKNRTKDNISPYVGSCSCTALKKQDEDCIATHLMAMLWYGFPMTVLDLRMLTQDYAAQARIHIPVFSNKLPGEEWAHSFLMRNKQVICQSKATNTYYNLASPSDAEHFLNKFSVEVEGIPPGNIWNYYEANLADDSSTIAITHRCVKYSDRMWIPKKNGTSIMCCCSGMGEWAPIHVNYKAGHLWPTWTEGGPAGAQYGWTASGWFDSNSFELWFMSIMLPILKKQYGKKILIGSYISSHINVNVLDACLNNNISFIALPHQLQPLHIGVLESMSVNWQYVLEEWKCTFEGSQRPSVPKYKIPSLLKSMQDKMMPTLSQNIKSGFAKAGLIPLNRVMAVGKSQSDERTADFESSIPITSAFIQCLEENEFPEAAEEEKGWKGLKRKMLTSEPVDEGVPKNRKMKDDVKPGHSHVSIFSTSSSSDSNVSYKDFLENIQNRKPLLACAEEASGGDHIIVDFDCTLYPGHIVIIRNGKSDAKQQLQNGCYDHVEGVHNKELSSKHTAELLNIAKNIIWNRVEGKVSPYKGGCSCPAFQKHEEYGIAAHLIAMTSYGFPITVNDVRMIAKEYSTYTGINRRVFKYSLPGEEWAHSFLMRNKQVLCKSMATNTATTNDPECFLNKFSEDIEGVPPENIWNYDELNMGEDPSTNVITHRCARYPEWILDENIVLEHHSSKGGTSIMCCCSGAGEWAPIYVNYKANNLTPPRTEKGPVGAKYGSTTSGWFDFKSFEAWFMYIMLPILKKQQGKKILIGSYISSHINMNVVNACLKNNVSFIAHPSVIAPQLQPLHVGVLESMKLHWQYMLCEWQLTSGGIHLQSLPKFKIASLLKAMLDKIMPTLAQNIKSGFAEAGLIPFNKNKAMWRWLGSNPGRVSAELTSLKPITLEDIQNLRERRFPETKPMEKSRKILTFEPVKRVVSDEIFRTRKITNNVDYLKKNSQLQSLSETRPYHVSNSINTGAFESKHSEDFLDITNLNPVQPQPACVPSASDDVVDFESSLNSDRIPIIGKGCCKEGLLAAMTAVHNKQLTVADAAKKFHIDKSTIWERMESLYEGSNTVLQKHEEDCIAAQLIAMYSYGFPVTVYEVRLRVREYLTEAGKNIPEFCNNMPGGKWVYSFLVRHNQTLAKSISFSRVSTKYPKGFLKKFLKEVEGVPTTNIWNYDEAILADNPSTILITHRCAKYPELTVEGTSIMCCCSAAGEWAPIYVNYKASHLWPTWTEGGPAGAQYGWTPSGWFDSNSFEFWFMSIMLPILKKQYGKKILIGSYISSHINVKVLDACLNNNISFIALPRQLQPLHIGVLESMSVNWQYVLEEWKCTFEGSQRPSVPKYKIPSLLKSMQDRMMPTLAENIKSCFAKAGLIPFNATNFNDTLSVLLQGTPANALQWY